MLEEYKPLKGIDNVYLVHCDQCQFLQFFCNHTLVKLEINPNGYIPKTGLLFKNIINSDFYNKEVLDLGCGYLGILSVISNCYAPKRIDSIDIDYDVVKWFQYLIQKNNFSNIYCFQSDYFENVTGIYDIILSNPPQMPMLKEMVHDSGGVDGRKYIIKILRESYDYLRVGGKLYILIFDFLGINQKTNDESTIIDLALKSGYCAANIVYQTEKKIKKESVTYCNLDHIKDVYPKYHFYNHAYQVCIVEFVKGDERNG